MQRQHAMTETAYACLEVGWGESLPLVQCACDAPGAGLSFQSAALNRNSARSGI